MEEPWLNSGLVPSHFSGGYLASCWVIVLVRFHALQLLAFVLHWFSDENLHKQNQPFLRSRGSFKHW
jgi:hypothetical protein